MVKNVIPPKIQVYNHFMDSGIWKDFEYHKGDVIYASYMKSGTTPLGKILNLTITGEKSIVPFYELRVVDQKEKSEIARAEHNMRVIKSHAPANAIPFCRNPEYAKYYVIVRDPRDILLSAYNKYKFNTKDETFDILNNDPSGRINYKFERPSGNFNDFVREKLKIGGLVPGWDMFEFFKTWFEVAKRNENVLMTHHEDMVNNRENYIRKIADFSGVNLTKEHLDSILEQTSFDYMKEHGYEEAPDPFLWKDAKQFFYRGTNGRWKGVLDEELSQKIEKKTVEAIGKENAKYLLRG